MNARYSTSNIPWLFFSIITLILGMSLANTVQAKSPFTETFHQVELRGIFTIIWGDPESGTKANPEMKYYLMDESGQKYQLIFTDPNINSIIKPWQLYMNWVVVKGYWAPKTNIDMEIQQLIIQSIELDLSKSRNDIPGFQEPITGPQPWVSILCKFADISTEPNPISYFQNMYGGSYPGLDHYWREQSYNTINVIGSGSFGWFTLPRPKSYYVYDQNGDGYPELNHGRAVDDCTAVADPYVYYPSYVGINMMFNNDLDCCAWGGGWELTLDGVTQFWRVTWEPPWGYQNIGIIEHEMGHGFGLPHSSGKYGQTYDNQWDVMSDVWTNCERSNDPVYGCLGQHTISAYKNFLEWIPEGLKFTATANNTPATINLERLAIPQTGNYRLAIIPIAGSTTHFYTVEARLWTGYDVKLPGQGVIIHEVIDGYAYVLDIDNNGNTGDAGAIWIPGEIFSDPTNEISVTVNYTTDSGSNITIVNSLSLCFSLTKNVSPSGSGSISANPAPNCNNGTQYTSGTVVQITANANSGYSFSNWSGDASGSANPTSIPMNSNKSVTANFRIVCPVINNWKGEYWKNSNLNGSPILCRDDFALDFYWGLDSPGPGIPADNYSARWTRTLAFPAGQYRFHMNHDDGARLFVDNFLIINAWGTCCQWETVDIVLGYGNHTIKMEMFENGGEAIAALWWERLDISGWRGEYFNNGSLSDHPVLVRDDGENIDFEWTDQSPDPLIQVDNFSARWSRTLAFSSGNYRFDIFHDDGARLYIDGIPELVNWCDNCRVTDSITRQMTEGNHDIVLEMWENGGWSAASLTITRSDIPPPPNDDINNSKLINPPLPYNDTLDTTGATSALDDLPLSRCNRRAGLATVWYRFTPLNKVSFEVDTFGSDYDTMLAVWTGSPGNLALWACNDDTGGFQSWLNATLTAGTTYYIEVAQYNGTLTTSDPTADTKSINPESIQAGGTLQLNIKYSNWIFKEDFETGNLSRWTSCITDNSDLGVRLAAAIHGNNGLRAFIDDNNSIYCTDDNPRAEKSYRARFYFHPKSIPMANGDSHQIFAGYSGTSTKVVVIEFRKSPFGRYQLRTGTLTDNSTWAYTPWFAIYGYRAYPIEVYMKAATSPGSNNGSLTFWIDGLQKAVFTNIDNDTRKIDRVRLGAVAGIDTGTRGWYSFDDFKSTRLNYIGP